MSGETEKDVSAHTVDTLNQMVAQRFRDLERLLDERHDSQKDALAAALATAQREIARLISEIATRFESVNYFREQLREQAATFMTRSESEAAHRELRALLDAVDKRVTEMNQAVIENRAQDKGAADQMQSRRVSSQQMWQIAAVLIAALGVAVGLILGLNN